MVSVGVNYVISFCEDGAFKSFTWTTFQGSWPDPETATGNRQWVSIVIPANTKHLYNIYTILDKRQRHWADVV